MTQEFLEAGRVVPVDFHTPLHLTTYIEIQVVELETGEFLDQTIRISALSLDTNDILKGIPDLKPELVNPTNVIYYLVRPSGPLHSRGYRAQYMHLYTRAESRHSLSQHGILWTYLPRTSSWPIYKWDSKTPIQPRVELVHREQNFLLALIANDEEKGVVLGTFQRCPDFAYTTD